MPKFGTRSNSRLETCDPRLQKVMERVIQHFDCSILCGHRNREEQEAAFNAGRSKARFGQSKHNSMPSMAVDVAPYPIDWNDRERFNYFAGFVLATAAVESNGMWALRWGGDWNMNWQVRDNGFDDLPHFEIVEIKE
jgi:hypothetical protein